VFEYEPMPISWSVRESDQKGLAQKAEHGFGPALEVVAAGNA
jgi:hypothetical protein